MKLSSALLGLLAASVMPTATAFAQTSESSPRPFAVRMTSEVTPVSHGEVRYPSGAAMRNVDGSCTIRFDVTGAGAAKDVEVTGCSSDLFRSEAAALVKTLKFDPTSRENATMNISWTLTTSEPPTGSASLR